MGHCHSCWNRPSRDTQMNIQVRKKALPIIFLLKLLNLAQTWLATAMADLVCADFFFAMRPYEYTKTLTTAESKRTKIITLWNINFYRNNPILGHDQDRQNTDWVNITLEYEKNDDRNESIGMYRSNHQRFCPVLLWGEMWHKYDHTN